MNSAATAIRQLPVGQACRQCLHEQRRTASTSRRIVSVPRVANSSSSSSASSSTRSSDSIDLSNTRVGIGRHLDNVLSNLRFEVVQSRPNIQNIWQALRAIDEISPESLTPKMLRTTIPLLSRCRRPPKTSDVKGSTAVAIRAGQGEALYERYRFVADRLEAMEEEPLEEAILQKWLDGFEKLSYAPGAWRIWEDAIKLSERRELQVVSTAICHSVLIATAKWLALKKKVMTRRDSLEFKANAKQALDQSAPVLAYMAERGQTNWITRSLSIRIIKEAGDFNDTKQALQETLGFNLDFPSASQPFQLSEAEATTLDPSARSAFIDRHTLNTVLSMYAKKKDLSKMMSIFEAAAYPIDLRRDPTSAAQPPYSAPADQNSFFTSARALEIAFEDPALQAPGPDSDSAPQMSIAELIAADRAGPTPPLEETLSTTSLAESSNSLSANLPSTSPRIPLNTFALNTFSFEILINTANDLERYPVSFHYLQEMLYAWQQERRRLRDSFRPLLGEEGLTEEDGTVLVTVPTSPRIGPSIHAFYSLYQALQKDNKRLHKDAPLLLKMFEVVKDTVRLLKEDIEFFTRVVDTRKAASDRLREEEEELELERENETSEPLLMLNGPVNPSTSLSTKIKERQEVYKPQADDFDPVIHLLLTKRIEIELDELVRQMEAKQENVSTERFITPLLYELSGRRKGATIARIRTAINRGERWLTEDKAMDIKRLALIASAKAYSPDQNKKKLNHAAKRFEIRRYKVRKALAQARVALPHLVEDAKLARAQREEEARQRVAGRTSTEEPAVAAAVASPTRAMDSSGIVQAASVTQEDQEPRRGQGYPDRMAFQ